MTLAPPRRWFRFSLATLFVVVAVSACVAWWAKDSWNKDPDEWIHIAIVGDPKTGHAMVELLTAKGIESGSEGSVSYYVYVRRRDAPRGCELIRNAESKLGPYQNWIADY